MRLGSEMMLSTAQQTQLQNSFALVYAAKARIADHCYRLLFAVNPDLQAMFQGERQTPQEMITSELALMVKLASSPQVNSQIKRLAKTHMGYGVKDAHFTQMRHALLTAMAEELGDALPAEAHAAWGAAFDLVADAMKTAQAAAASQA